MITMFSGTPGSGKSYDAVRRIVENLKSRKFKRVYTNLEGMHNPLNLEVIKNLAGLNDYEMFEMFWPIDNRLITEFWDHVEPNSLIVLDEIHLFFNVQDSRKDHYRKFADWASTHRHNGFELLLITQNIDNVAKTIRNLIEWNYEYRKINFLGSLVSKKYLRYAYMGHSTRSKHLSRTTHTYNPKIFLCYQSYVTEDIKENDLETKINVLKHPIFLCVPLSLCFFFYFLFFKSSLFSESVPLDSSLDKIPALESVYSPSSDKFNFEVLKDGTISVSY